MNDLLKLYGRVSDLQSRIVSASIHMLTAAGDMDKAEMEKHFQQIKELERQQNAVVAELHKHLPEGSRS